MKRKTLILLCLLSFCFHAGCSKTTEDKEEQIHDYGVFLSYEGDLTELSDYKTIVIDAQYISKDDILNFKAKEHTVYSYINIGSLENFRDYYDAFKDVTLGAYEHWEEEFWIDVSDQRWQDFILNDLAQALIDKGIDGIFVDNCDVYYQYRNAEIFDGLTTIMKGLKSTGKDVIINGGDSFLNTYCNTIGKWSDIVTGINQESVFSSINWDDNSFGTASNEDHEYFTEYIESYGNQGADIFLLEYTTDIELINEIKNYCHKNNYRFYISDELQLDVK